MTGRSRTEAPPQRLETLVQAHPRRPAQRLPGAALVEPVRGAELLGQEPGQRRHARSPRDPPRRLHRRARPPRPAASGTRPRGPGTPAAAHTRSQDLAHRPGLAVGHHQRLAVHVRAARRPRRSARRRRCRRRWCRSGRSRRRSAAAGPPWPAARSARPAGCRPGPRSGAAGSPAPPDPAPSAASASRSADRLGAGVVAAGGSGSAGAGARTDQGRPGVRDRRATRRAPAAPPRRRGRPPPPTRCRRRWPVRTPPTARPRRPWRPGAAPPRARRRPRSTAAGSATSPSTSAVGSPDGRRCSTVTASPAAEQRAAPPPGRSSRWRR